MKACTWLGLLLTLSVLGCAAVDPKADYERVARAIEEATGQSGAYRAESDETTAARVDALLEGGLSVAEAVEIALLNNPSLQATVLEVGLARADVVQSALLSNPSLGGLIRFPLGEGKTSIEAGLAHNLIELWHRPPRRRFAEEVLERAVLRVAYEGATLASEIRETFFSAVAARQSVLVEEQNLQTAQSLLDMTLARQEAGAATEIESNTARTELLTQEVALRSARFAAFDFKRRLTVLLGLGIDPGEIDLAEPLPPLPQWKLNRARLLTIASAHRLDLAAAEAGIRAAEQALSLEKRLFLRSAGGGVALETEGSDVALGPSVSLEIPVFDQNQARIAKARMRIDQATRVFREISVAVAQEVRGAHEQLLASLDIARFYQERIAPLSEANLELTREAFLAGKTSFLTVLESQKTVLAVRRQSIERSVDLSLSVTEIEAACGRPLNELLTP